MYVVYEETDRDNKTDGHCASLACYECSARMSGTIKQVINKSDAERFIDRENLWYEDRGNCRHFRGVTLKCQTRFASCGR